jgi:hypothetical protein
MSLTVANGPHVRAPWLPIAVVLAIAAAAMVIVLLTVGSSGTTPATSGAPAPPALAPPRYTRDPWATVAAPAIALPSPADAEYCRAPRATSGSGSSDG